MRRRSSPTRWRARWPCRFESEGRSGSIDEEGDDWLDSQRPNRVGVGIERDLSPRGGHKLADMAGSGMHAMATVDRAQMNNFLKKTVFGTTNEEDMDEEMLQEAHLKKVWCGLLHPETPIQ